MHTLLLLAALSNQITFTTTQQGDIYTVIPQVTLNEPCVCQVQILSVRDGVGDKAIHSKNKRYLYLLINRLSCLILV
ncbi:curli production assembly protein CsgC [Salmonella enterica subsp. enterica serovar Sanjuan]|uniref:Curli assembly protein CsgC n=1 Tax=Salmonella enterica subsp. enterica serovar Sanjuan TaxID=1160765 RepID=A0A3S4H006_SALET|nr:curli production assembly protein CsgC [Salmonella enterica subsp. enterica serovar Sanjuan]